MWSRWNISSPYQRNSEDPLEAAKEGRYECIESMIESEVNVNVQSKYKKTSLMFAAQKGFLQCVKLLLEAGAHVNDCDSDGKTSLMFAAQNGFPKCMECLIKSGE